MQALRLKTQSSPFEAQYFSQVPYLLGDGQAMQYPFWPKSKRRTPDTAAAVSSAGRLPARRDGEALEQEDVEFDIRLQRQTDAHLMPIEQADGVVA